ncbi:hypothetical protein ACTXT7_013422 [Hymenolepis weldensis]
MWRPRRVSHSSKWPQIPELINNRSQIEDVRFTSACLYKFFGGLRWKINILMTGLFVPGLVMSVFLLINTVLLGLNSSGVVSFTTILSILAMWLLVSLPLSLIGALFGFRKRSVSLLHTTLLTEQINHGFDCCLSKANEKASEHRDVQINNKFIVLEKLGWLPFSVDQQSAQLIVFQVITVPTRTNQIPRQVPPQACYTRTLPTMLLTGLLPFGCIFIQLFFIFNSIWGQQLFFMFGFLFLVFVFFLVCIVETSILSCYYQLCSEATQIMPPRLLCGDDSFY